MSDLPFNSASYKQFLTGHKIMASRCTQSGDLFLPPRPLCPHDFSSSMEWAELSGRGRLAAFSIIHIPGSAMLAAGYDRDHPYCAGVVALEEGPHISAQILGVDVHHPETIQVGMVLAAVFLERGQGEEQETVLAFQPA